MLVDFKVRNFRSFDEEQCFSLESEGKEGEFITTNFKSVPFLTPSAGVYGSNGSGKSNLFKALLIMRHLIVDGFEKNKPQEGLTQDKFCLSKQSQSEPTFFAIKFIHNNKLFDYAFSYTETRIIHEKLSFISYKEDGLQEHNIILKRQYNSSEEKYNYNENLDKDWYHNTRSNVLALTTATFLDNEDAKEVYEWFRNKFCPCDNNKISSFFTLEKTEIYKSQITTLMQKADIGILDYKVIEKEMDIKNLKFTSTRNFFKEFKESISIIEQGDKTALFVHKSEDTDHNIIPLEEQSEGTKILFGLAFPIFDVLENGRVLFIDEIDRSLHPHLAYEIIRLFQDPTINTKNAQIIFTAHDTYFMNYLTREQIWFTEKNKKGATEITGLLEYKIEDYENFRENYHLGRYNAVPHIAGLWDYGKKEK